MGKDKVYLSTAAIPGRHPVSEILRRYFDSGITKVELGSSHAPQDYESDEFKSLLDKFEIILHNYFPAPSRDFAMNPISSQPSVREDTLKQVFMAVKFCKEHDSGFYSFHPGFLNEATPPPISAEKRQHFGFIKTNKLLSREEGLERLAEFWNAACKEAGSEVQLAVENQGHGALSEHLLLQEPWEIKQLTGLVSPDYPLRILVDVGHLFLSAKANGFSINEFMEAAQPYVSAFHVHDNDGLEDNHYIPTRDGQACKLLKEWRQDELIIVESVSKDLPRLCDAVKMLQDEFL